MGDEDLIKRIQEADPDVLKDAIIKELEIQELIASTLGCAKGYNSYREYLYSILKRYETGEPKIYRGKIQPTDIIMEVLKYFGISLSATEYNKIKQSVERKPK